MCYCWCWCWCCLCMDVHIHAFFCMYFWRLKFHVRYLPWLLLILYLVRVSSKWTKILLSSLIWIGSLFWGFHHSLSCTENTGRATTPIWFLNGVWKSELQPHAWVENVLPTQWSLYIKNYIFLGIVFCLLQEHLYMKSRKIIHL